MSGLPLLLGLKFGAEPEYIPIIDPFVNSQLLALFPHAVAVASLAQSEEVEGGRRVGG
jgi:hypothetical protein